MKRFLYYLLPSFLRPIVRRIYYLPVDIFESTFNLRQKNVPPRGCIYIGRGDFIKIGKEIANLFISLGGLKPDFRVLDVGCGIGRLAIPLLDYLNEEGSYEGFDIVKKGIKWCKNNISSKNPKFNFKLIDISNDLYNAQGKFKAKDFKFPYQDNEFDFVFLTSVFTHMGIKEVENYVSEISRVLKQGRTCFATFFIYNDKIIELMQKGRTAMNFKYDFGNYRLYNKKVQSANVAYSENYLYELYENNSLEITAIYYGKWSGMKEYTDYQDIVIARKKN